ncbi:MAG: hypothetical protein Q9183_000455 [Haloplaca sp. 2 TL-2023]
MTPQPIATTASDSSSPAVASEYASPEQSPTFSAETLPIRTLERTVPASAPVRPHSQPPVLQDLRNSEQLHVSTRSSSLASVRYHDGQDNDAPRQTIVESFAPRIALFASEDTDAIAREKGFIRGFYSLLRPFAEYIPGKVVIRDSVGASKAWEDFSIRLIEYNQISSTAPSSEDRTSKDPEDSSHPPSASVIHDQQTPVDAVVDTWLRSQEADLQVPTELVAGENLVRSRVERSTATHGLYLRKLLSNSAQVPYETFSHPVACMIAVSSRSPDPLEKIRHLYSASGHGNAQIPPWVAVDYLRYYVLVHDEDRDDITTSTALFDLMKRHFGLHCYLLRIRSVQCGETKSPTVQLPQCYWMSAQEEFENSEESGMYSHAHHLILLTSAGRNAVFDAPTCVFESDATSIRSLIREMVTQSVVPFMESRIVTWNDQVVSKRRGLGGRFMSLSKRWTAFGSSRGSNAAPTSSQTSSNSNFDPDRGYYPPESPEAIMRQLADYALMLRDFKMAYSTYDNLRADFSNDKAWTYHASASELAVVSYLLIPQTLTTRSRSEMVDQKLDTALYSYLTRCSMPAGAVRSLIIAIELLMGRGTGASDDAVKWAIRLLELGILTPIPQILVAERIADICCSRSGTGSLNMGSRRRLAVFWNILASTSWMALGKHSLGDHQLHRARSLIKDLAPEVQDLPFASMRTLYRELELQASESGDGAMPESDPDLIDMDAGNMDEANEQLNDQVANMTFGPTNAGGFSTIEANHPGFEDIP